MLYELYNSQALLNFRRNKYRKFYFDFLYESIRKIILKGAEEQVSQ